MNRSLITQISLLRTVVPIAWNALFIPKPLVLFCLCAVLKYFYPDIPLKHWCRKIVKGREFPAENVIKCDAE